MQKLTDKKIKNIEKLNKKLVKIEKKIFDLVYIQNAITQKKLLGKEDDITDFELQVDIVMYSDEKEIANWTEYFKSSFLHKRIHQINDGKDHNVTSCCWKNIELNAQHHCWLLHSLYDDQLVEWNDILKINLVWFDINIRYQYSNAV